MDAKTRRYTETLKELKLLPTAIKKEYNKVKEEVETLTASLKQVRDAAFDKLGEEFGGMETEKQEQQKVAFGWVIVLGIACAAWPIVMYSSNGSMSLWMLLQSWFDKTITTDQPPLGIVSFIAVEILLIYFFRIALHNFYAIRDQILAIRTRRALCQFTPTYLEFTKDKDRTQLQVFNDHIFSEIPARLQKIPATFDLAGQVATAFKKVKQ